MEDDIYGDFKVGAATSKSAGPPPIHRTVASDAGTAPLADEMGDLYPNLDLEGSVVVTGVAWWVKEAELRKWLELYGEVAVLRHEVDEFNGKATGKVEVCYADRKGADSALDAAEKGIVQQFNGRDKLYVSTMKKRDFEAFVDRINFTAMKRKHGTRKDHVPLPQQERRYDDSKRPRDDGKDRRRDGAPNDGKRPKDDRFRREAPPPSYSNNNGARQVTISKDNRK